MHPFTLIIMGYYTRYSITAYDYKSGQKEKIAAIIDEYTTGFIGEALTIANDVMSIVGYNPTVNSCKWYGHEADMMLVSKKHPTILFRVYGAGEESGDIWDKWFLNGKMQTCKAQIIIPDFDPKLLK